ncbi:hypothetical protein L9F63_019049, partial [Diploptera punctata]
GEGARNHLFLATNNYLTYYLVQNTCSPNSVTYCLKRIAEDIFCFGILHCTKIKTPYRNVTLR